MRSKTAVSLAIIMSQHSEDAVDQLEIPIFDVRYNELPVELLTKLAACNV